MKIMINEYIKYVEDKLNSKKIDKNFYDDLLIKISFFQHERLIHFLVTMLVGIITVILLVTSLFIENIFIIMPRITCITIMDRVMYNIYLPIFSTDGTPEIDITKLMISITSKRTEKTLTTVFIFFKVVVVIVSFGTNKVISFM